MDDKHSDFKFKDITFDESTMQAAKPIRTLFNIMGIIFLCMGLFCMFFTTVIIMNWPSFLMPVSVSITNAIIPFVSYTQSIEGIYPTSSFLLFLSFIMFSLKNRKFFSASQTLIAAIAILSFLFYLSYKV
ncbi:MAG: hypothetical protein ACRQFF_08465 [Sphaerochaeta sp.]